MKNLTIIAALALLVLTFVGCSENYSNGERIGMVTQFSKTGVVWKSHEGHLNLTQTGMNSSSMVPFDFSIDNDNEDPAIVAIIDSAATLGWKVKLVYHETFGKNWLRNRGETDHFITTVEVLDRNPVGFLHAPQPAATSVAVGTINAEVGDTLTIVVIRKSSGNHQQGK